MIKRLIYSLLLLGIFLTPLAVTASVGAQFDPLETSCDAKVGNGGANQICKESEEGSDKVTGDSGIITRVANILSIVAAIIAVIVIMIAGITMMTSQGDAGKVASSRNTIIYTAIGLVVIVLARTIVVFVFGSI
jgi:hypothetical protein